MVLHRKAVLYVDDSKESDEVIQMLNRSGVDWRMGFPVADETGPMLIVDDLVFYGKRGACDYLESVQVEQRLTA